METSKRIRLALLAAVALSSISAANACDVERDQETRYYSTPSKPEARRGSVLAAFKKVHPLGRGRVHAPAGRWTT